jgi:predicted Zn-dependent protease
MRGAVFGIVLSMLMGAGCTSGAGAVAGAVEVSDDWAARRGGITAGERLRRLRAAAAPVLAQAALAGPVRLAVLDTPRVGAYSFPDGRVFVSRGLVDLLAGDDEALAAAVAHELGHLYRPADQAQSLGGATTMTTTARARATATTTTDAPRPATGEPDEFRADATACALLRGAGLDPGALADVLRTVADSPDTSADQDRRLAERIRRLPTRSAAADRR